MAISGLLASGLQTQLDDVNDRRLKELVRQLEEKSRADQLDLQNRTLDSANADRQAGREIQHRTLDMADLKRVDAEHAAQTQQRAAADMAGVLAMPGMSNQDKANEIMGSGLRTGMVDPAKVIEGLTRVEKPVRDPIADHRAMKEIDREFQAPEKPAKPGTHVIGGSLVDDNGKVIFTDPSKEKSGAPTPYSTERAARTVQSVDELMGKVNGHTAGLGSLLANLPATDARNFKAELDTLKANVAFNELTAMREASKTGGALGQISDRESQLLMSALGALDAGQSPANLRQQLQKVKDSVQRWQAAQQGGAPIRPEPSHGAVDPRVDALLKKYGGGE